MRRQWFVDQGDRSTLKLIDLPWPISISIVKHQKSESAPADQPGCDFFLEPFHGVVDAALRNDRAAGAGSGVKLRLPPMVKRQLAFDDRIIEFGIFLGQPLGVGLLRRLSWFAHGVSYPCDQL